MEKSCKGGGGLGTLLLAVCLFWISLGSMTSCIVAKEITGVSLWFVRSPRSTLAKPGDEVEFECEPNLPAERVRWKLNGRFLPLDDETGLEGNGSRTDSIFQLKPKGWNLLIRVERDEEKYMKQVGEYQCVAWFGAVALTSLPARLDVAHMDRFPFHRNVSLEIVEGNSIVVECASPVGIPPPVIRFFHSGSLVGSEQGNSYLQYSGNLHILHIRPSQAGTYTCTATNEVTGKILRSDYITRVVVHARGEKQAPTFIWKPREVYSVVAGTGVSMGCVAVGNPPPVVKWRKLEGRLHPERSKVIPSHLQLNVTEEDQGVYVCEAVNGVGSPVKALSRVELLSPVVVSVAPQSQEVEEDGEVKLRCEATGKPFPKITWVFNGHRVRADDNIDIQEKGVWIRVVEKKHAGLFQCFAANAVSSVFVTAMLSVLPKQITAEPRAVYPMGSEWVSPETDLNDTLAAAIPFGGKHKGHRGRNRDETYHREKKGKKKKKQKGDALLIPPSRPNITKLSDESVMVRWSVPPNDGLKIMFFRVQYKETSKARSDWITIDDDIPSHIRSYEVAGLTTGQTYRFRVAAVYSNDDNKLGANSAKFVLQKDPTMKRPSHTPVILHTEAVSETSILIQWQYVIEHPIPVEGFFIYYRSRTSAGDYTKVTVLGDDVRIHIVKYLHPQTIYDVKMQCFNMAGTSNFSSIVSQKTVDNSVSKTEEPKVQHDDLDIVGPDDTPLNEQLYMVLGTVLGGLLLLILLLLVLYHCKQKYSREGGEDACDKYEETREQEDFETSIFGLHSSCGVNGHMCNGYLSLDKSSCVPHPQPNVEGDKNQNIVETTFAETDLKRNDETASAEEENEAADEHCQHKKKRKGTRVPVETTLLGTRQYRSPSERACLP